jgi:anti-sigma regulatory factor (Ser/Thr protein kinase)
MLDDPSSRPTPVHLTAWADTLPSFAAETVARSDLTRPHVYTQLLTAPQQVRVLRSQITTWTRQVGLPGVLAPDVVLATDEAVSNAVEHAYPGTSGLLTLFAACTRPAGAVRVVVADHGGWRPQSDPGFRGRGLMMMEKLAHVFRLVHGPLGTTVVLGWSLSG